MIGTTQHAGLHPHCFFTRCLATFLTILPLQGAWADGCQSQTDVAPLIKPYDTVYAATFKGVTIDNHRSLTVEADNTYKVNGEMSVLFIGIREYTRFKLTDLGVVQPQEYLYERDGLGDKKDYHLRFDWKTNQAISQYKDEPWTLPIQPGMQDLLSQQVMFRLELLCDPTLKPEYSYPITKKKRQRTYTYVPAGEEIITTKLGKLNTIKFNKLEEKPGRKTTVWLAKDWDYLIAKLVYREKNGSENSVTLKSGTLNGHRIRPLN